MTTSTAPTYRSALRISGTLTRGAMVLAPINGQVLLMVQLQPPQGMGYRAHVPMPDATTADSQAQRLRPGTVISLGGDALMLAPEGDGHWLQVLHPRDLVAFSAPVVPAPDTFTLEG